MRALSKAVFGIVMVVVAIAMVVSGLIYFSSGLGTTSMTGGSVGGPSVSLSAFTDPTPERIPIVVVEQQNVGHGGAITQINASAHTNALFNPGGLTITITMGSRYIGGIRASAIVLTGDGQVLLDSGYETNVRHTEAYGIGSIDRDGDGRVHYVARLISENGKVLCKSSATIKYGDQARGAGGVSSRDGGNGTTATA